MTSSGSVHSIHILGPRGNTLAIHAAGEGPALFLLHGFPLDHRMWSHQLHELRSRFHVIAVDFRGFGASTLDDQGYSMADLAKDVEFVRHHLAGDQTIYLAGLSMGGYVAFEYWRLFSERIRGLILCNTKPTADDEAAQKARQAMGQLAIQKGTWQAVEPMFPRMLSEHSRNSQPETVQLVQQMMRETSAEAVVAAQSAMAARQDFSKFLPAIKLPTLVVAGEHDPIAPPELTRQWASQIPSSTFAVIDKTSHLSPLESPSDFSRILLSFI